ncbi:MAG: hypothetical protein KGK07_07195 [Chloroflexota bacterium]|nr:hypothetical protein [Chloroflexota bacterium]
MPLRQAFIDATDRLRALTDSTDALTAEMSKRDESLAAFMALAERIDGSTQSTERQLHRLRATIRAERAKDRAMLKDALRSVPPGTVSALIALLGIAVAVATAAVSWAFSLMPKK